MAWYKTGTADFTNGSAAIVGHGTEWVANAGPGEAVAGPDGRFYEIQSVNSNTSITLARPYSGASLAGQAYDILPSQSYTRDLAAQAAALINSYASITSNAGAGKFGDGTLGAPGIRFINDTDTGIRRTTDGTFALVANGVDVATIGPGGMTLVTPNIGAATGTSLALSGALMAGTGAFSSPGEALVVGNGASASHHAQYFRNSFGAFAIALPSANGQYLASSVAGDALFSASAGKSLRVGSIDSGATYGVFAFGGLAVTGQVTLDNSFSGTCATIYKNNDAQDGYIGISGSNLVLASTYGVTGVKVKVAMTAPDDSVTLDVNGNLTAGQANGYSSRVNAFTPSGNSFTAAVGGSAASSQYLYLGYSDATSSGAGNLRFAVAASGNVVNANNSYGAISDLKFKQDIVDARSQWADVKALTVRKFRFKSDPTGFLMMGLIAQEAEAVSPGLVETTDDFEDVVIEPARTEVKIVQRQKVQKITVEQSTPTLVDGRYVLRMVPTEIDVPLFEDYPLYVEDGSPIMEIVEPEQLTVTDEEGNVVTPAKPAVTRQAVHRVPVMEDVEEAIEIPAKTERRPTGTQTKSVKYSILYMKAVKALQEAMERIEVLEAEVAAIKGG